MRRIKSLVPKDVLKQLYYSFIHSHFTYAITSYQSAYSNQTNKLNNLINKALKLVLDTNSANLDILKNKSMMNYDMVVEHSCCINMYRILMTDAHNYFKNKISNFQTDHDHGTRAVNLEHINLPFYRLSKCKRSFIYRGLYFWNKLPLSLRNVSNLKCFHKTLKEYIFARI